MYVIPLMDVSHPETNEPIINQHEVYALETFKEKMEEVRADGVPCIIFTDEDQAMNWTE